MKGNNTNKYTISETQIQLRELIGNLEENNISMIEKNDKVIISSWSIHELDTLKELEELQDSTKKKIVFITPFSLVKEEKWYEANWNEKIIAMEVEKEIIMTREEILNILPNNEIVIWDIESDISDSDFWKSVMDIKEEIYGWNINQLILSRKFSTDINIGNDNILNMFSKLLQNRGQYMTFLFNTPDKIFMWASPEKHLVVQDNNVIMNPIAWTIWKWEYEDFFARFTEFLSDKKEIWELAMVIDEELKMMLKISKWWTITVPLLKESWVVIHTEADLIWRKKDNISMIDALRETMYAPTLVWWPIESAFSEIKKYENNSREYYWWAFGTLWKDFLDTAIVIRTAFIDKLNSILTVRAWAWIVKDSIPELEANETILKSNWFFGSFKWLTKDSYIDRLSPKEKNVIYEILDQRKKQLSSFYIDSHLHDSLEVPEIKDKNFILINNWDDFVYLSWFMIEKMWGNIEVVDNKDFDISTVDNYDVVLLWPWYWDINNKSDIKMTNLLNISEELIKRNKKILGICLWHQAICKTKWFKIKKQEKITQWEQLYVDINWKEEKLWFYNSFSPVINWNNKNVDIFLDDRILNYKEDNISSTQSHPESIMSINWFSILKNMILDLLENN